MASQNHKKRWKSTIYQTIFVQPWRVWTLRCCTYNQTEYEPQPCYTFEHHPQFHNSDNAAQLIKRSTQILGYSSFGRFGNMNAWDFNQVVDDSFTTLERCCVGFSAKLWRILALDMTASVKTLTPAVFGNYFTAFFHDLWEAKCNLRRKTRICGTSFYMTYELSDAGGISRGS